MPKQPSLTQGTAHAEPITMQQLRFGYFPKLFTMRDKQYAVHSTERCWTVAGRKPSLHFSVNCELGTVELVQDINSNTWTAIVTEAKP